MITFLVSDLNRNPLDRLIRRVRRTYPPMQLWTYAQAFRRLRVPAGTLIFTDFDLLSDFELDAAGTIAAAAETAGGRILNHPLRALERASMLRHLNAAGLNSVEVTQVDSDAVPARFPVFIRMQGGCERPDTGLLRDADAYQAAKAALRADGRPLRGRIAISFEAEHDARSEFRKYGAFRIGEHIVPQHILRSRDWVVKKSDTDRDAGLAAEEIDFIRSNPHREWLMQVFDAAGHEFGRADYTIRAGELVLFEINSNPSFPHVRPNNQDARRRLLYQLLKPAFEAIDTGGDADIPFALHGSIGNYVTRMRWNPVTRRLWRRRLANGAARASVFPPEG